MFRNRTKDLCPYIGRCKVEYVIKFNLLLFLDELKEEAECSTW